MLGVGDTKILGLATESHPLEAPCEGYAGLYRDT